MSGYILQGKKADGSMVNIDLAAKYDALGEEISVKYATKSELADAGNFDENGSYPNLTAGTATEATHAASADTATNSTYAQTASTADTAGYATTAKGDEDGNDIKNTYATKSELDAVDENASRFIENGSYPDLVAGTSNFALQADQAAYASSTASAEFAEAASHADSADSATKATQDGQGRNIANTYATKSELAAAGQFDPNGNYPNLTAGDATHAASADAATKASQDASGNDIAATYATKSELAAAGQFDPNGNYPNLTAGNATNATNDGQGRNISETYALKSEVGSKMYRHFITIRKEDDPDYGVGIFCYKSSRSAKFTTVDELYDELNAKGFNNSNAVYPATGSYGSESSGTALLYLRADLYTVGTGGGHTKNIKRIIFYTAKGEGLMVYSSGVNYSQGIVTDIVMDD